MNYNPGMYVSLTKGRQAVHKITPYNTRIVLTCNIIDSASSTKILVSVEGTTSIEADGGISTPHHGSTLVGE